MDEFCFVSFFLYGYFSFMIGSLISDFTGPPPPLPPLQPSGMDAPPNSATSSVPTVVTTGIHHQPPPAPPSLFTGAVMASLIPMSACHISYDFTNI